MTDDAAARSVRAAAASGDAAGIHRRVCEPVQDVLGATGVTVTLLTHLPERHLLCASGELALHLDELQFAVGEGPSIAAAAGATTVLWRHVSQPQVAWPLFGPMLREELPTLSALHAFPLRVERLCLGSTDVLYRSPRPAVDDAAV